MTLECIKPFGHFAPGDTIDVPDGAIFDKEYFTDVAAVVADDENMAGD